jgi:hypothetical protein
MKLVQINLTDEQFNFILSIMKRRELKTPAKVVECLVQAVVEQSKEGVVVRTPRQREIATMEQIEDTVNRIRSNALCGIQLVKSST